MKLQKMMVTAGWVLWSTQWMNTPMPFPEQASEVQGMQEWRIQEEFEDRSKCQQAMDHARQMAPSLVMQGFDTNGRTFAYTVARDFRCLPAGHPAPTHR